MAQPLTPEQCFDFYDKYVNTRIPASVSTYYFIFAPIGVCSVVFALAFAIVAIIKLLRARGYRLPGPNIFRKISQVKEARKEKKLRKEQEVRARAMRLSGLEVEMGRMGRSENMNDMNHREAV